MGEPSRFNALRASDSLEVVKEQLGTVEHMRDPSASMPNLLAVSKELRRVSEYNRQIAEETRAAAKMGLSHRRLPRY